MTKPKTKTAAKTTATKKPTNRGGRKPGKWGPAFGAAPHDKVKAWRKQVKMSRATTAKLLGVSSTSVQNWETRHSIPMPKYQSALLKLMGEITEPEALAGHSGAGGAVSVNGVSFPPAGPGGSAGYALNATGQIVAAWLSSGHKVQTTEDLSKLVRTVRLSLA